MLFYTATCCTNYFHLFGLQNSGNKPGFTIQTLPLHITLTISICRFLAPCRPFHCLVLAIHVFLYTYIVLVSITASGNATIGQQYTLTCNVRVASGLGTPAVQWVGPGCSAPIFTGGDFTVNSTSPYTLTIDPLRQSHAGQFTCQAMVGNDTGTASVMVEGMYILGEPERAPH